MLTEQQIVRDKGFVEDVLKVKYVFDVNVMNLMSNRTAMDIRESWNSRTMGNRRGSVVSLFCSWSVEKRDSHYKALMTPYMGN